MLSHSLNPLDKILIRLTNQDDLVPFFNSKSRQDVLRILRCLQYIRLHLPAIAAAVHTNEIGDQPGQYRNASDAARRLLRDEFGTSFHLNRYATPAVAEQALSGLLQQFEFVIHTLTESKDDKHLIEFLNKLEWDGEVGCLEARTRAAMEWATNYFANGLESIESIIQRCQAAMATKPSSSDSQMTDNELFTEILTYCSQQHIRECTLQTHSGRERMVLTPRSLASYLHEVLSLDIDEDVVIQHEQQSNKTLLNFLEYAEHENKADIRRGHLGMYQYWFSHAESANQFVAWLHKQPDLLSLGISKARAKQENQAHVVRLTKEQYHHIQLAAPFCMEPDTYIDTWSGVALGERVNATKLDKIQKQWHTKPEGLKQIIEKLRTAECHYLGVKYVKHYLLHVGAVYRAGVEMIPRHKLALVRKLSPSVCDQLAAIKSNPAGNMLHVLFQFGEPSIQEAFVARLSETTCNQLAAEKNQRGWTVLHTLIRYGAPTTQSIFIGRLTTDTLKKLMLDYNDSALLIKHFILNKTVLAVKSPNTFKKLLINTASPFFLWTTKHVHGLVPAALLMQHGEKIRRDQFVLQLSFSDFLQVGFKQAENSLSVFELLLLQVTPEVQIEFFERMSPAEYAQLFKESEHSKLYLRWFLANATEAVLQFVVKKMGNFFFTSCLQRDMEQNGDLLDVILLRSNIPEAIKVAFLQRLPLKSLEKYFANQTVAMYVRYRDYLIDQPALVKTLVEHAGILTFRFKKWLYADISAGAPIGAWNYCIPQGKTADNDVLKRRLPIRQEQQPRELQQINSARTSHQLLLKVVREPHLEELLGMLQDTQTRPPLRRPKKATDTHKFFHLTGEIKQLTAAQKRAQHTHTRKTSTTLMPATDLSLRLFGDHDEQRDLIGFLFNATQCVIKARLAYDTGTFTRGWVGTLSEVKNYAAHIKRSNYTDSAKFHDYVDSNAAIALNEVLAELSQSACLGIFIAKDTISAREIAISYQKKYAERIGVVLPIVLLDRTYHQLRLLHKDEILAINLKRDIADIQFEATAKTIVNVILAEIACFLHTGAQLPKHFTKLHTYLMQEKRNKTSMDSLIALREKIQAFTPELKLEAQNNVALQQLHQVIRTELSRIVLMDKVAHGASSSSRP